MQTLNVDLGDRSYPIHIGPALLDRDDLIRPHIAGRQVMIVTNDTVAPLYQQQLATTLARIEGLEVITLVLPDGEAYKNLQYLERIWTRLLEARFSRTATLIALGGGVIGDMTGFAAATYQRGIAFIQIPTTLLAQVDSSVGGKTGVNHSLGKNMIGAFHQPQLVLADTDTLNTLPQRELSAGMAEVIKYGLLGDLPLLAWLEEHMEALMARDATLLTEAILRSCACKARVVAEDEREGGVRALLNLGHTFGHAIETEMGYGCWLHGEAVGSGMYLATVASQRMGWLDQADVQRVTTLLEQAHLPTHPPENMTPEAFLRHMAVDKKNIDGRLRLVLLKPLGQATLTTDMPQAELEHMLTMECQTREHQAGQEFN